jgi:hypothetical protein
MVRTKWIRDNGTIVEENTGLLVDESGNFFVDESDNNLQDTTSSDGVEPRTAWEEAD